MKKIFLLIMTISQGITLHMYAQDFVWAKQMTSTNMEGRSVKPDATGNVYTTGYFQGTVDFDPGPSVFNMSSFGGIDIFISKLDASGNFIWAKQMGGTSFDEGYSIAIGAAGDIYTTGRFTGVADFDPGAATFNMTGSTVAFGSAFISKLDAAGNFVWAKTFTSTTSFGRGIALDASDNVYSTGFFLGTCDFDPGAGTFNLASTGGNDNFVSKLDAAGNFVWAKAMNGTSLSDRANGIAVSNGVVYVTGDFKGTMDFDPGAGIFNITSFASGFTEDIFLLKLDDLGNFVWAKRMGSDQEDYGLSVAIDAGGNVYTTGSFRVTCDFDPNAGTFNLTAIGLIDAFVSRLDASGNFVWARQFGASSNTASPETIGYSIAIDATGNVYTTGSFEPFLTDFDPGTGTYNLTSFGDEDIFISKLNASGNFVSAKQMGGTGRDRPNAIAVNSGGNIYTTGFFQGTADFDPGAGVYNLTGGGMFISKLGSGDNDGDGYTIAQGDCDDNNPAINPGATEICNSIDDDCDGLTDDADPSITGQATWYADADNDGFGNVAVSILACSQPSGYVANDDDCNDNNAAVKPTATEICNGIDDDCDGLIDDADPSITGRTTWYADADNDGFGNAAVTILACGQPSGYVANDDDCNDNNAAVKPTATEICNGIDDDCDGLIDDADPSITGRTTWYADADNDGFGNAAVTILACGQPSGYVANDDDCNDNNAAVNPGATEICSNSIDDDCDGLINEGCTATPPAMNIADVTVMESAGSALVPVTLSASSTSTVWVLYITVNGTARFPRDYWISLGVLTFLPGQTVKNISVPIISDAIAENNEQFYVLLLGSLNAQINDGSAIVTITEQLPFTKMESNPVINDTEIKLVVPNPQRKQEQLRIFGPEPGSFDVILTDVNGKVVANLKNYRNNWAMSGLAGGIYFYHVLSRNDKGLYNNKTGKLLIMD